MIKTVEWTKDGVRMLDQRLLPSEEKYLMLRSYDEVAEAIRKMVVRGAPAIGVSAAMGIALGANQSVGTSVADLEDDLNYICDVMAHTRPTAVNLFWAIERMRTAFERAKSLRDVEEVKEAIALNDADLSRVWLQYAETLAEQKKLEIAFIVTDEDRLFESVVRELPDHVEPVRLYEAYLRNFEIESGRGLR